MYRGLDLRLDRPVALKVMDSRYAGDQQFLTRFQREARAVARLKDPGLVAVYDQGIDSRHPFLVMELIEGGTLRELLRERGPMPPHAVAAVLRAGARRSRRGAPRRPGAPRHQARERADLRRRRGQDRRLRSGPRRRRGQDHLDQRHPRHRGLPVARAGEHRRRRPTQRRLRRRHADLRTAHRRHPVHRRHRLGGGLPADGSRRAAAERGDRRRAKRNSTSWCGCATARDPAGRYADAPEMGDELDAIADELGLPALPGARATQLGAAQHGGRAHRMRRAPDSTTDVVAPAPAHQGLHPRRAARSEHPTTGRRIPAVSQDNSPESRSTEFDWARQRAKRMLFVLGRRSDPDPRRAGRPPARGRSAATCSGLL